MSEMMCCPLSVGDGEPYRLENKSMRRAAKEHQCEECTETIAPGTRYEHVKALGDDRWWTHKTCLSCVEIRAHFACGRGWIYGRLREDLEESLFPNMKAGGPCMEGLSPAAKGRLFTRRMAWLCR